VAEERDKLAKALRNDSERTREIEQLVERRTSEIQQRLNRTLLEETITELTWDGGSRKEDLL
jgi:hypothetical protein